VLRLADLTLSTPLLLAPIAGYCDLAFRLIARSCGGVGLACTDLLDPEAIARETLKTLKLAATNELDSPLCMQLYGGDADRLCHAARWAEDRGAHVIDINMGCPVDKVLKKDGGSRLLCDPDNTLRLVDKVRAAIRRVPLTAKMRLGWDDRSIVAPYLARRLEDAGIAMITVHGRTTEMKFSGEARLDGIAQVAAAVKHIPVIGNGDVRSPHDAARMMRLTGCAGVMIGRAALSRPWIFRDTSSYLSTGVIPSEPSLPDKCRLMQQHFSNMVVYRGERYAIQEFRKRVSWWAKSMQPCRQLKEQMRQIGSVPDFDGVVARFLEWRLCHADQVARGVATALSADAA
jgi:nifR3 family TIM-barrel protein